jgi:hypothetical protein
LFLFHQSLPRIYFGGKRKEDYLEDIMRLNGFFFLFLPHKAIMPLLSFFFLLLLQKKETKKKSPRKPTLLPTSHMLTRQAVSSRVRSFRGHQPHRSNLGCAFKKFSFYLFCFLLHFVINEIELDVKYLALNKIS